MVVAHVTVNEKGANIEDSSLANVEFVPFTTASSGDYYDCKRLSQVDAAFASQSTTDGIFIQVSWTTSGRPRVTLTLKDGSNVVSGYLTIIGRL